MTATGPLPREPEISVIVPARNEEANLAACLESLVAQTGVEFEIIVINDHSTDGTADIARSFSKVRAIEAGPLAAGWTGKNNAVATGAREARGKWLLFTDADTIHLPGSLARALQEAKENHADLLSYSPEQIAVTFWEMAVLPVVFAELALHYPPSRVSDPNSPEAAANGQYILVKRDVYESVGGHAAAASEILEDVALARRFKAAGHSIRFRYAADAVRTRMYRNFRQLREGWTKNLALLFPRPGWLAVKTLLWWAVPIALLLMPEFIGIGKQLTGGFPSAQSVFIDSAALLKKWWLLWVLTVGVLGIRNGRHLHRANFDLISESRAVLFGMPIFAYLLLRSRRAHARRHVSWKGRTYEPENKPITQPSSKSTIPTGKIA